MRIRDMVATVASRWRPRATTALAPVGLPRVTLVGHAYRPTGRGEHVRAIWRALAKVGVYAAIYDIDGRQYRDDSAGGEFRAATVQALTGGVRIFSVNGDRAKSVLRGLRRRQPGAFRAGYNIVYPAWELPRYPTAWASQLDRFDEVWTATGFVHEAIQCAASIPVLHIRNACEPEITEALGRGYFGLPENRYLILFSFDLLSLAARKNPWATIDAFRKLIAARPRSNAHLVLKLNHPESDTKTNRQLHDMVADIGNRVTLIAATMTNNEARNLTRCCDCYISLHRAEGFGRGPAEAMFFGKPVVATGWSGNMEYMNRDVSFPVEYRLVPVLKGEFSAFENQAWAEADTDHAAEMLIRLVDDPELGQAVGERARDHMLRNFSDAVLGLAYRERLLAITASGAVRGSKA